MCPNLFTMRLPGPPWMPVLGTTYLIPRDRTLQDSNMVHKMRAYDHTRTGLFFGWIGLGPVIFVTDAELIKAVIGMHERAAGERRERRRDGAGEPERVVGDGEREMKVWMECRSCCRKTCGTSAPCPSPAGICPDDLRRCLP